MKTVNLLGTLDWATTPVPLGTPDVQIARLRVDPVTKASTSLDRFPEQAALTDVGPTLRLDLSSYGPSVESNTYETGRTLRTRSYGAAFLIDGGLASTNGLAEVLDIATWEWTDVAVGGANDSPERPAGCSHANNTYL